MIDLGRVAEWFASGGWVMAALSAVGLTLAYLLAERFLDVRLQMRAAAKALAAGGLPPPPAVHLRGLRRIGLIHACVVIAPLLGLLGTVIGIIQTFSSIVQGGYISEMGDGIRKALLTTQYGLAIAAPGLLAERILNQQRENLRRLLRMARNAGEDAE